MRAFGVIAATVFNVFTIHRFSTVGGRNRRRSARGVTLIATVLLSVLAATIALVVIRSTVLSTRAEAVRTDYGRATVLADQIRADFERELAKDSTFYTKYLFSYERPRQCTASPLPVELTTDNGWVVANTNLSDKAWPLECGSQWLYPVNSSPLVDWNPSDNLLRAEISPPQGPGAPLTLRALAAVGNAEAGVKVTYGRDSAGAWTVYSGSNLNLEKTLHADSSSPSVVFGPQASAYTTGVMRLPSGGVDVSRDRLAAEKGFVGRSGDSSTKLYTNQPVDGSTISNFGSQQKLSGFDQLRTLTGQPLSMQGLRASISGLESLACPTDTKTAANLTITEADNSSADSSSFLCLRSGYTVVNTDGDPLSVPAARAWMVLPSTVANKSVLQVYYTDTVLANSDRCVLSGCKPRQLAASDAIAGRNPNSALPTSPSVTDVNYGKPWKMLGTFYYPSTTVVSTGADTYLGRCGGFYNEVCDAADNLWSFKKSVSILAGSQSAPADVWFSGNVLADDYTNLADPQPLPVGIVATGSVVVPSYAAPENEILTTQAFIMAAGFGKANKTTDVYGSPSGPSSEKMFWHITGSLAAPRLGAVDGVASIKAMSPTPSSGAISVPPVFPSFTNSMVVTSALNLSSRDVCGDNLSNLDDGSAGTCVGVW